MIDNIRDAQELLLGKIFIQKGSKFQNRVDLVSYKEIGSDEIVVTYKTLNNNSHTNAIMEVNQFLGNHFI